MNKAETALLEMIEKLPDSVCLETGAYVSKEASDIIVFYHTAIQMMPELIAERNKYLALLQEIATVKDHAEEKGGITTEYTLSVESIQRHVRQQLEKWGVRTDE